MKEEDFSILYKKIDNLVNELNNEFNDKETVLQIIMIMSIQNLIKSGFSVDMIDKIIENTLNEEFLLFKKIKELH